VRQDHKGLLELMVLQDQLDRKEQLALLGHKDLLERMDRAVYPYLERESH
jgi:hypothetical protein